MDIEFGFLTVSNGLKMSLQGRWGETIPSKTGKFALPKIASLVGERSLATTSFLGQYFCQMLLP